MKTYIRLLLAFLLLILFVPQVRADEPPKDGLHVEYYENGKKKSEGHYKNGKKYGVWTVWHENGKKRWEGYYKNGQKNGLCTMWDKNGQKIAILHYKNGAFNGLLPLAIPLPAPKPVILKLAPETKRDIPGIPAVLLPKPTVRVQIRPLQTKRDVPAALASKSADQILRENNQKVLNKFLGRWKYRDETTETIAFPENVIQTETFSGEMVIKRHKENYIPNARALVDWVNNTRRRRNNKNYNKAKNNVRREPYVLGIDQAGRFFWGPKEGGQWTDFGKYNAKTERFRFDSAVDDDGFQVKVKARFITNDKFQLRKETFENGKQIKQQIFKAWRGKAKSW